MNISIIPNDKYFTLSSLTIGEIYYLTFNYQFNCPYIESSFSFGLYEIVDKWIHYIDNNSDTFGYNATLETKWIVNGSQLNGYESENVTYSFMASSSQHEFVLKVCFCYLF